MRWKVFRASFIYLAVCKEIGGLFELAMRRNTQKSIFQLAVFCTLLLLILLLNRTPSENKVYAWNKIRYRTIATKYPEARGICPGLREGDGTKPALVVSRVKADGDPTWLNKLASLYHLCVYEVDAPVDTASVYLQVPANRGHEAMAYLTFLIDNYEHIPAAGAVFVHGSRWAWHNDAPDYDNAGLLARLNVSAALAPWGYHNLRCDWSVSTCPGSSTSQRSLETSMRAALEPWNARVVSDAALPHALAALFGTDDSDRGTGTGKTLLGHNSAIRAQCCAQFALARENAWRHSREEYVALRQWLLDTGSIGNNGRGRKRGYEAPIDDRVAGRILSYLWHILFLQPGASGLQQVGSGTEDGVHLGQLNAMSCPSAEECYCRLYGRCGLKNCISPGHCYGQYRVPPNLKLPVNWASTHT